MAFEIGLSISLSYCPEISVSIKKYKGNKQFLLLLHKRSRRLDSMPESSSGENNFQYFRLNTEICQKKTKAKKKKKKQWDYSENWLKLE